MVTTCFLLKFFFVTAQLAVEKNFSFDSLAANWTVRATENYNKKGINLPLCIPITTHLTRAMTAQENHVHHVIEANDADDTVPKLLIFTLERSQC